MKNTLDTLALATLARLDVRMSALETLASLAAKHGKV